MSESLLRRYFVHAVQRVFAINQIQNYLEMDVDTDLGPMQFIMRYASESAQSYGDNGRMLLDVEENRFLITDMSVLPDEDRRLFERYIYW